MAKFKPCPSNKRHNETGAALILVLGIVSVMSAAAVFSFENLSRLIQTATALQVQSQAREYALAGEVYGFSNAQQMHVRQADILALQAEGKNKISMPLDNGEIDGELVETSNCFNIASLVSGTSREGWRAKPEAIVQFAALLEFFNLGQGAARAISSAVADWQDSDNRPLTYGAEDGYYADESRPYRTAGAPMTSLSELLLVRDVTPELVEALGDLICVDPLAPQTRLNVNSLQPKHAPLVRALLGGDYAIKQVEDLIAARPMRGYDHARWFWQNGLFVAQPPKKAVKAHFDVYPVRFRLTVNVAYHQVRVRLKSMAHFYRNGGYTVIMREFGA